MVLEQALFVVHVHTLVIVSGLAGVEDLLGAWITLLVGLISLNVSWSSFAIGVPIDLIDAGRLVKIWTKMNAFLARVLFFVDLISMAGVLIFPLIIVFLQFFSRPVLRDAAGRDCCEWIN